MKIDGKWIPEYEGLYYATPDGKIYNKDDKQIRGSETQIGYVRVSLTKNGKKKCHSMHRLIATTFLGEAPDGKPVVNHINGIKSDNRLANLEWVSASENTQKAIESGIKKKSHVTPVEVVDLNTNIHTVYPTVTDAAKAIGYNRVTLQKRMNQKVGNYIIKRYAGNTEDFSYFAQLPAGGIEQYIAFVMAYKRDIDIIDFLWNTKQEGYETAEILKAIGKLKSKDLLVEKERGYCSTAKLEDYIQTIAGAELMLN